MSCVLVWKKKDKKIKEKVFEIKACHHDDKPLFIDIIKGQKKSGNVLTSFDQYGLINIEGQKMSGGGVVATLCDLIEDYILDLFDSSMEDRISLNRSDLSMKFDCVPSQINNV